MVKANPRPKREEASPKGRAAPRLLLRQDPHGGSQEPSGHPRLRNKQAEQWDPFRRLLTESPSRDTLLLYGSGTRPHPQQGLTFSRSQSVSPAEAAGIATGEAPEEAA